MKVRLLIERNYSKLEIKKLFKFINHYIRFENKKNYAIFASEIQSNNFNEQKSMGIFDMLIEHLTEEGRFEEAADVMLDKRMEEEERKKNRSFATNLIVSTDFDDVKIAALVGTDEYFVKILRAELNK